ncbi:hypothetical protein ELD05_12975 [Caldicellulosiruptor changbaiensis]|uniref:Uncharacterized protein n=1 Tax=Caldicellulosiruptor changbaiensis TaxID=1222016 RepID=A0A3T0D8W9_9FIRM|nr:hypothetical protein [Caldicellulosiruptor changbaiensis]AZT91438.1 hypothetical protein ELD05_12975 [Caldicellulosiruptor changbaiensis]
MVVSWFKNFFYRKIRSLRNSIEKFLMGIKQLIIFSLITFLIFFIIGMFILFVIFVINGLSNNHYINNISDLCIDIFFVSLTLMFINVYLKRDFISNGDALKILLNELCALFYGFKIFIDKKIGILLRELRRKVLLALIIVILGVITSIQLLITFGIRVTIEKYTYPMLCVWIIFLFLSSTVVKDSYGFLYYNDIEAQYYIYFKKFYLWFAATLVNIAYIVYKLACAKDLKEIMFLLISTLFSIDRMISAYIDVVKNYNNLKNWQSIK